MKARHWASLAALPIIASLMFGGKVAIDRRPDGRPAAQAAVVFQPASSNPVQCADGARIGFERTGGGQSSSGNVTCGVANANAVTATAVITATDTPAPTATGVVTPTATTVPTATATLSPTATTTPVAEEATQTPTPVVPTPTPAGVDCKALHDSFKAAGPDGKQYPTWHPPVDATTGCVFGHEHGADPRTARADSSMPAFGYANAVAGISEPHEGYKVFVLNPGFVQEDSTAVNAFRMVFHHGSGGVGRYTSTFHSVEYDFVALDGSGRFAHIYGMMDTGPAGLNGSTCDSPRKGAKDFATLGCADPYEIWNGMKFQIIHPDDPFLGVLETRWTVMGASALFDPITTRDPSDNGRLIYTQTAFGPDNGIDPASPAGAWQGCTREMYFGPVYSHNLGSPTTYYTDAYGKVQPAQGPNTIKQEVSATTSNNNEIFKFSQSFCGNGIHTPN